MASIKESFSTVAQKTITADISFQDGIIMFRTEEMTEYEPLTSQLGYFDGAFVKITFKQENKSEELPTNEVDREE
jgi:hypothetical protein